MGESLAITIRRALTIESAWILCSAGKQASVLPLAAILDRFQPAGHASIITKDHTTEAFEAKFLSALQTKVPLPLAAATGFVSRAAFHLAWLRIDGALDDDDLFEFSVFNCFPFDDACVTLAIDSFRPIDFTTGGEASCESPYLGLSAFAVEDFFSSLDRTGPVRPALPAYLSRHHKWRGDHAVGTVGERAKSPTPTSPLGTADAAPRVLDRLRGYAGHVPRGAEMIGVRWGVHDELVPGNKKVYYHDGLEAEWSRQARIAAAASTNEPPRLPVQQMRVQQSLRAVRQR